MKVAIASGKGGTGKTTLSTNLAAYLAEKQPVVLADLDVEEPNSGLFLQGDLHYKEAKYKMIPYWENTNCTLCANCQDVCNSNAVLKINQTIMVFPELCHSCYACSELCSTSSLPMQPKQMGELKHYKMAKLDFIESRLKIGEEQAVPLIKQTIDYVEDNFPEHLQIFDAPPGTSCPVVEATKNADLVILVTEPTPFGLHDLKLAIETMRQLKRSFGVVLNRHGLGDNLVEQHCQEDGVDLIAKIPNSRAIAEKYAAGKLLYNEIPTVLAAIHDIALYIDNHNSGGHK